MHRCIIISVDDFLFVNWNYLVMRFRIIYTAVFTFCLWRIIYGQAVDLKSMVAELNEIHLPISVEQSDKAELLKMDGLRTSVIVGLGEATHGTKEFLQYKNKIVKFMVEDLGLKTLFFEIDFGESILLNKYINDPEYELRDLMKIMQYYPWRTEEVLDLFDWIRIYNSRVPPRDRVKVLGVDCVIPKMNLDFILDSIEPSATNPKCDSLINLGRELATYDFQSENIDWDQYINTCHRLIDLSEWTDNCYRNTLGHGDHQYLHHSATNLLRCAYNNRSALLFRDSLMTQNIVDLMDDLGEQRYAFWAHNIHIANYHPYRPEKFTKNTVGYFLKEEYGDKYLSIGFGFTQGTFSAVSLDSNRVTEGLEIIEDPPESSFNYICENTNLDNYLIPMYLIEVNGELGRKLDQSMDFLHITSSFKEEWRSDLYIGKINLKDYDYMIYFKRAHHTEIIDRW